MSNKNKESEDFFAKIDYGVRCGAIDALKEHKRLGLPIHVWKNGKVVEIPADEIVIREEPK